MQSCPEFFLKSLLESPENPLEICSVKFVDTLNWALAFVCFSFFFYIFLFLVTCARPNWSHSAFQSSFNPCVLSY